MLCPGYRLQGRWPWRQTNCLLPVKEACQLERRISTRCPLDFRRWSSTSQIQHAFYGSCLPLVARQKPKEATCCRTAVKPYDRDLHEHRDPSK